MPVGPEITLGASQIRVAISLAAPVVFVAVMFIAALSVTLITKIKIPSVSEYADAFTTLPLFVIINCSFAVTLVTVAFKVVLQLSIMDVSVLGVLIRLTFVLQMMI